MKKILLTALSALSLSLSAATATADSPRQQYTIYVDDHGVMRRSDTGAEVSYYGTNYTTPFAHAYRALPRVGADRKATIDLDVLHMKRLGFNGFRLHLWDAELADADGNLLTNDHLDLLDYMIARLEEEGIDIILTAQTNFGNGYPERNIDTGAFTYDFDKCDIHANPKAQAIQERYLTQLARHLNPYTGRTYAADRAIIGIEINNEPCHTAPARDVTRYIDRMARTLRSAGFDRIILYNVSHNGDVVEAYYKADIQATTYQWYPDGLVAGHERRGNLLPYVDAYPIPWSHTIPNYDRMARVVYEFDPGDVLCTYLYPAVVRTFRHQGFQWATQFAYDPTPIARYNTEYQTHFLNLLYTPGKALGMMIAGEAMRQIPRGADFGTFPADTTFRGGDARFEVSYPRDLSMLTTSDSFIYTNDVATAPSDPAALRHIAGHASSPLVTYPGTGAYFLDRLGDTGAWRLELLPDVGIFRDPFTKPSLRRPLASLYYAAHPMTLRLPGLRDEFLALPIANADGHIAENTHLQADMGTLTLSPGVYILAPDEQSLSDGLRSEDISVLARYCAPRSLSGAENAPMPTVLHTATPYIDNEAPLTVTARVLADKSPRRVVIYPSDISFWREDNTLYDMTTTDGVNYTAIIPSEALRDGFRYNIVVEAADYTAYTYPQRTEGTPLDWDALTTEYYISDVARPDEPFILYGHKDADPNVDIVVNHENGTYQWRAYVADRVASPALHLEHKKQLTIVTETPLPDGTTISLTSTEGLTYTAPVGVTIPISDFTLSSTPIIPTPYPTFLPTEFTPAPGTTPTRIDPARIEFVTLTLPTPVPLLLTTILLE